VIQEHEGPKVTPAEGGLRGTGGSKLISPNGKSKSLVIDHGLVRSILPRSRSHTTMNHHHMAEGILLFSIFGIPLVQGLSEVPATFDPLGIDRPGERPR